MSSTTMASRTATLSLLCKIRIGSPDGRAIRLAQLERLPCGEIRAPAVVSGGSAFYVLISSTVPLGVHAPYLIPESVVRYNRLVNSESPRRRGANLSRYISLSRVPFIAVLLSRATLTLVARL